MVEERKTRNRSERETPIKKDMESYRLQKSKTQPGIILKQYESVLTQILSSSIPKIVPPSLPLPDFGCSSPNLCQPCRISKNSPRDSFKNTTSEDVQASSYTWNENIINAALLLTCASNPLPSQSYKRRGARPLPLHRALGKRVQLRSMIRCVVPMVPDHQSFSSFNHVSLRMDDDGDDDDDDNAESKSHNKEQNKFRIIDFAGGSGHLALPLALLFPQCEIVLVDLKKASLDMAHARADAVAKLLTNPINTISSDSQRDAPAYSGNVKKLIQSIEIMERHLPISYKTVPKRSTTPTYTQQTALPNLFTFHGPISAYEQPFNIGMALHACGEATDLTLRKCGDSRANFIACPCCIGKLSRKVKNPYIYQATMENTPTVHYPQSIQFKTVLECTDWDVLAKAADFGEGHHTSNSTNKQIKLTNDKRNKSGNFRKVAKTLVEVDRLLFMKDKYHYQIALTKMEAQVMTPKNDILLGWQDNQLQTNDTAGDGHFVKDPYNCRNSDENIEINNWNTDFQNAMLWLANGDNHDHNTKNADETSKNSEPISKTCDDIQKTVVVGNEWTEQEYNEIKSTLQSFITDDEQIYKFNTGQTTRMRKLVHNIAETMNLRHWSEGKRNSERFVIVAKR